MMIKEWLPEFLFRLAVSYPPADWPAARTEAWEVFEEDWRKAFARNGVSEREADDARTALAETPPRFRADYIASILSAVKAMRATAILPDRDYPPPAVEIPDRRAVEASADCPECGGTGWAKRRGLWHSIARPFVLNLTCRCPLGVWRSAHDHDRVYDSLQANPDVWDGSLTHRTWSPRPVPSPLPHDPATVGLWRYLAPGEAAPAPLASLRDVAAQTAKDLAPNRGRRWPDGLGRVEPAVPIPPKPPASVPMPAPDRAEGEGEVAA